MHLEHILRKIEPDRDNLRHDRPPLWIIANTPWHTEAVRGRSHHQSPPDIGYWLSAGFEGRGIATRAVRVLIFYGFDMLHLKEIQISVAVGNRKSCAICEPLGLVKIGAIPHAEELYGNSVDHVLYAISKQNRCAPG